jgi:uncharacterized membrane protein YbhN (UPF0104 family)
LVFGLVFLGVLLGSADVGRVLRVVSGFHPRFVLFLLALTGLYQALRAVQWFLLLRVLDRQAPGRVALMAYMGGEVAKALPGGQYFQTYLLRQAQGVPMARSAAATTLILWLEVVVSLLVVLVLGVGAWPWLRPACLLLLGGLALLVLALRHRPLTTAAARLARRHPQVQAAWVESFATSAQTLLRPQVLLPATGLCSGYLLCGALKLWAIAAALGVPGIGLPQALVSYMFALGVGLVIPIPLDLGLTEVGGIAVLMAFGASAADALAIMLTQRVLGTLLTGGIALTNLTLLCRQVAAALHAPTHAT